MKGPTPRRLLKYVAGPLGLSRYLREPGDGRPQPKIPAKALLWGLLIGELLREHSFLAIEALAGSRVRSNLGLSRSFGDDALAYFTERLDPALTRTALAATLHKAKRNKAFDGSRFIGLVVDGTGAGRSRVGGCDFCRPFITPRKKAAGYHHKLVMSASPEPDSLFPATPNPMDPVTVSMPPVSACCSAPWQIWECDLPITWSSMERSPPRRNASIPRPPPELPERQGPGGDLGRR